MINEPLADRLTPSEVMEQVARALPATGRRRCARRTSTCCCRRTLSPLTPPWK